MSPVFDPEGSSSSGWSASIYLMKPDGTERRCLVDTAGPDSFPAWSPDGRTLAFVGGPRPDIYTVRADGTQLRQLTETAELEVRPVWSPDGQRIAYSTRLTDHRSFGTKYGPFAIRAMARDGSHDQPILTSGGEVGYVELQDWSPDGETLLYSADLGTGIQLWAMKTDGTHRRSLAAGPGDFGSGAVFSPDGRSIAFQADLNGGCIYRSDSAAKHLVRLTQGCSDAFAVSWSPDGRWIVWAGESRNSPWDANVMRSDGSQRHTIVDTLDAATVDWQPHQTS